MNRAVHRPARLGILESMKRVFPMFALLALSAATAKAETTETRNVPAFRAIELAGVAGAEVTVGPAQSVRVVGEAEDVGKLKTTVIDGRLEISTPRNFNSKELRVIISVPDLTQLELSGTGGMVAKGISNSRLSIDLSGTGGVTLEGTTGSLGIDVAGTGSVNAKNLAAKEAIVDLSGVGSAVVRVSDSIQAKVSGVGSLAVHGKPARVKKSVSGVGSVSFH